MNPVRRAGAVLISAALALLINATLAHAQGRGGNQAEPPTLKGKVAAYEADASITLETKVRGGQINKTEFSIVKDKTKIEPKELSKLLELIKPAGEHEFAWRGIPWMTDVAQARQKAAAEGKMLIHWSMVDHPLGRC